MQTAEFRDNSSEGTFKFNKIYYTFCDFQWRLLFKKNQNVIQGPNKYTLVQLKDAVYDGLRAIKNAIDDGAVIPGAGAFEVAANQALLQYKNEVKGKQRLGVQAFAEALLVIPKTLGKLVILRKE